MKTAYVMFYVYAHVCTCMYSACTMCVPCTTYSMYYVLDTSMTVTADVHETTDAGQ